MKPTDTVLSTDEGSRPRRRTTALLAVSAAAALIASVLWVQHQAPDRDERAGRVRLDAVDAADQHAGRASSGLEPPADASTPATTDATPVDSPPRAGSDGRLDAQRPSDRDDSSPSARVDRGGTARPTATSGSSNSGGGGAATSQQPAGAGDGSFLLPGSKVQAPITGPVADLTVDSNDDLAEHPAPEPDPEDEPEDRPDPDEIGCPNLGLLPIGGFNEGEAADYRSLYPRFRALASAEWARTDLVCGHALELWRDLVIQRLEAAGRADGAIITAADGSSIAMRLSEVEWSTYRFRYDGGPTGTNLLGFPLERTSLDGVPVIRTTGGALVFAQPDALGIQVIGGLWDFWIAKGGPSGSMGLPVGIAESAAGELGQLTWQPGLASTGARQSFQNGWVFLPGVISDVDAAAQPADRYQWHPWSDLPPKPTIDYRGHIVKLGPTTWYVDATGIRHWIPTSGSWMCATWDLKATQYVVEAYELDAYPLGSEFVCEDYKDPVDDGA